MFDTMKIARKIREARIGKNMTQMNLADAMGVSYQAVSNWERGNSMPDISKLEDLCNSLSITVTELLGMESKETAAVEKVLQQEELTVDELADVAPILPPEKIAEQTRKAAGGNGEKFNIAALAEIAPFMDDDILEEILEDVEVESLAELEPLAPYLDEDVLDKLVRRAPADDYKGMVALAPYLDEETLDYLVKRGGNKPDRKLLEELLPYLDDNTIDYVGRTCAADGEMFDTLGPYLEEDTIAAIADICIREGKVRALSPLYPYMDSDTVRKIVKAMMKDGDLETMKEAAPYI